MTNYVPHIGMRNVKTSLALFLTLMLYNFLPDSRDPIYAGLAAILCVQPTVESSYRSASDRIIGTCLGGAGGYIFMLFSFDFLDGRAYYLLIALGNMILIYICNLIKRPDTTAITCIVFFLICTSAEYSADPLIYTSNRVLDTFIGILAALAVNILIKPKHDPKDIKEVEGNKT